MACFVNLPRNRKSLITIMSDGGSRYSRGGEPEKRHHEVGVRARWERTNHDVLANHIAEKRRRMMDTREIDAENLKNIGG